MLSASLLAAVGASLWAQPGGILTVAAPPKTAVVRNAEAEVKLSVRLRGGYHVNSNAPADEYLIPMALTWNPSSLRVLEILYPKGKMETYSFSSKPLSVYTGNFEILTRFHVPPQSAPGASVVTGKLRYQACTTSMCLPPRTVEVKLPVEIR
ncbi:MAG: protein-disulfide reductase DsbD domain-containing protein [Bryobacteraceae bacterium]